MIDYRAFRQTPLQPVIARHLRADMGHGRCPFVSEQEFEFAKLNGLKPGGSIEPVAKIENDDGVIVSRISIWPTRVFMIVRARLNE